MAKTVVLMDVATLRSLLSMVGTMVMLVSAVMAETVLVMLDADCELRWKGEGHVPMVESSDVTLFLSWETELMTVDKASFFVLAIGPAKAEPMLREVMTTLRSFIFGWRKR